MQAFFMTKRLPYYLVGLIASILFLSLSYPENRMENDDGYLHAYLIKERPFNSSKLYSAKLTYYLPFCKSVHSCALWITQGAADAYLTMCGISIFFSSLTLLILYKLFRKRMKFSHTTSLLGCLFLLFSYGYWRYGTEADVYAISFFWLTLSYYLISKENGFYRSFWLISFVASISVAFYKPNFIAVFIVFPIVFLYKKQFKYFVIYLATGGGFITLFYLAAYLISQDPQETTYIEYLFGGGKTNLGSPVLSLFTLSSNIFSANFIFGIPMVSEYIQSIFHYHIIDEEVFAASQNGIFNYLAIGTLIAFTITFLLSIVKLLRFNKKMVFTPSNSVFCIWIILYGAIMAILDPNAPEPWLPLLLPISILVASAFNILEQVPKNYFAYSIIAMLFLHNAIGGIAVIYSSEGDYIKHHTEWLVKNTDKNDLILTAGSNTMHRYLMYKTKAQTITLERDADFAINTIKKHKGAGNIYLTEGAVHPNSVVLNRSEEIKKIKLFLKPYPIEPIDSSIYRLNYPSHPFNPLHDFYQQQ